MNNIVPIQVAKDLSDMVMEIKKTYLEEFSLNHYIITASLLSKKEITIYHNLTNEEYDELKKKNYEITLIKTSPPDYFDIYDTEITPYNIEILQIDTYEKYSEIKRSSKYQRQTTVELNISWK